MGLWQQMLDVLGMSSKKVSDQQYGKNMLSSLQTQSARHAGVRACRRTRQQWKVNNCEPSEGLNLAQWLPSVSRSLLHC